MRPAEWLQEVRMKRFQEAYYGWQESPLSREEAARILGISPPDRHRCHYIKAAVKVHRYLDDTLAVFHGPRKLARYDAIGIQTNEREKAIA